MSDQINRAPISSGNGFYHPKFFGPDHWAAIIPTGSFSAIVDGNRDGLGMGYLNRWQYLNRAEATAALDAWNGAGQPDGWFSAQPSDQMTVYP